MTEVVFHFNAADKRTHACRLLRKAHGQGARLLVVVEPSELDALDVALWTLTARDFVPHAQLGRAADAQAHAPTQSHSPILLTSEWPAVVPNPPSMVLVNLGHTFLDGFDRFARVIEVVSQGLPDREQARARWKRYRALGVEPTHHDFADR